MRDITRMHPSEPRALRDSAHAVDDEAGDAPASDEHAPPKQYDQRLEDWLTALEDEAGRRYWLAALEAEAGECTHELLSSLAARTREVAESLERMAEKARTQGEPGPPEPSAHLLHLKPRARRVTGSRTAAQSA